MSGVVVGPTARVWAFWVAGVRREEDDAVVVDLPLSPIVEPISVLSKSADFASVCSSLDGLVLAWRADSPAKAALDG